MTERLSISMPDDVAAEVRDLAAAAGVPVSAWIVEAAKGKSEHQRRIAEGLAATREFEAEYGKITEEERAQARAELIAAGVLRIEEEDGQRAS